MSFKSFLYGLGCFRDLDVGEVRRVFFWMRKFGASSPKRTVIFSNDPSIMKFECGKLSKRDRQHCRSLVKKTIGKDGRPRVSGNRNLKRSEHL